MHNNKGANDYINMCTSSTLDGSDNPLAHDSARVAVVSATEFTQNVLHLKTRRSAVEWETMTF